MARMTRKRIDAQCNRAAGDARYRLGIAVAQLAHLEAVKEEMSGEDVAWIIRRQHEGMIAWFTQVRDEAVESLEAELVETQ